MNFRPLILVASLLVMLPACESSPPDNFPELSLESLAAFEAAAANVVEGFPEDEEALETDEFELPACAQSDLDDHAGGVATNVDAGRFDADAFGLDFDQGLRGRVHGYYWELRDGNEFLAAGQAGYARDPDDGRVAWGPTVRMHVASSSKMITAMALVKALEDNGIARTEKIENYLPPQWKRGPGIENITFDLLLRHLSGFPKKGGDRYGDAQLQVRQGADNKPSVTYAYSNTNYALARILLGTVNGATDYLISHPTFSESDVAWDIVTTSHYRVYVMKNVFDVAGVSDITLEKDTSTALGYRPPPDGGDGWFSGSMVARTGAIGWHTNAPEMLDIVQAFEAGKIVSDPAMFMKQKYGTTDKPKLDDPCGSAQAYFFGGSWGSAACPRPRENNVFGYLPGDLRVSIFFNSCIIGPEEKMRRIIWAAYLDSQM